MSVRLTLVCHAATAAVRAATFPLDEPLDANGLARASALAGSLRGVDAAWASPSLRTRETAAALGVAATPDPALRDLALGAWAGRSLASLAASEPEAVARWTGDPGAAPHGGESVMELLARVRAWLATVVALEGRIVAVTHPAVIRAAIVGVLDAEPRSFWRIDVAPLCGAKLQGRGGRWTLRSLGPLPPPPAPPRLRERPVVPTALERDR
ncbi:MAG: histidine phosphatase family protein [Janthinobacterium lividum]